eukprot:jgi/Galph1/2432/GphlegSOOS_G1132.1
MKAFIVSVVHFYKPLDDLNSRSGLCLSPNNFFQGCGNYLNRRHRLVRNNVFSHQWWKRQRASVNSVVYMKNESVKQPRVSVFGIIFLIVTYTWAMVFFPVVTFLYPFCLAFDRIRRRALASIALFWLRLSLFCCRVPVIVRGEENLPKADEAVVYIANHQSYLDIYVLAALKRSFKFVSKIEVFSYPIIGWAMSLAGYVGLKRGDKRRQWESFKEIVEKLKGGVSLVMFPEGTRSPDGKLLPFKIGPFKAAKQAHVPLVPLTISGTREIMPSYAWLPILFPRKPVVIYVHPMIQVDNKSEQELNELCKSVIEKPLVLSTSTKEMLESH